MLRADETTMADEQPRSEGEPSGPASSGSDAPAGVVPGPADQAELARVLQIEVPVIVRLASRIMSVGEIMELSTGSIVEFEKSTDSPLDLMINNKCIGQGRAVKVVESFGLEVLKIASVQEKIEALGPGRSSE